MHLLQLELNTDTKKLCSSSILYTHQLDNVSLPQSDVACNHQAILLGLHHDHADECSHRSAVSTVQCAKAWHGGIRASGLYAGHTTITVILFNGITGKLWRLVNYTDHLTCYLYVFSNNTGRNHLLLSHFQSTARISKHHR